MFDGADAQVELQILLNLGSYITSTEAVWKLGCHGNMLRCCICFVITHEVCLVWAGP